MKEGMAWEQSDLWQGELGLLPVVAARVAINVVVLNNAVRN
jgi:hypothetical protein